MLKIRLTRIGRRNAPAYRIVVSEARRPRDGRHLEVLGHFNPTEDPEKHQINKIRYDYWRSVGAQPTEAVMKLLAGKYQYVKYQPAAEGEEAAADKAEVKPQETAGDAAAEPVETTPEAPVNQEAPAADGDSPEKPKSVKTKLKDKPVSETETSADQKEAKQPVKKSST